MKNETLVSRTIRETFGRGELRIRGLGGREFACPRCGKSASLKLKGYMFSHGRFGEIIGWHEVGQTVRSRFYATPVREFIACPFVEQWNDRVYALRLAGLDASEPVYEVFDRVRRAVGWVTRGRLAAQRVADRLNAGEGAWGHARFSVRKSRALRGAS
jgi:hypothetical protein